MSGPQKSQPLNTGNFTFSGSSLNGIALELYENLGAVEENVIFGVEGGAFFNHAFQPVNEEDIDYFALQPLDGFVDIAFAKGRRSLLDAPNGITLRGGFLDTAGAYGNSFPLLGAGVDLYFRTESDDESDEPSFFGKATLRAGGLGGVDVASEDGYDTYETLYDDVYVYCGALTLGLKFGDGVIFSLGGLYGHVDKDDDYTNFDRWENEFEGPDLYDKFFGASPGIRIKKDNVDFSAAYYFLRRKGGDTFNDISSSDLFSVDNSITSDSHRISADLFVRIMKTSDFIFGFGARGNYYLYDREDTYGNATLFGEPIEGDEGGSNQRNQDRTYAHGYFRFLHDFFDLQLAIGYSEKLRKYTSDCPGEWAGCEMSHSGTEGGFDMLVKMGLKWGGEGNIF